MNEPLIELRNVEVALNGQTILHDVTWSLNAGEHWSVLGGNGSGKSTFLRLLRGDVWPTPGRGERIYRFENDVQTTAIEVRRHIALVSPESQERYLQQEWRLTARDVVRTGFAQSDLLYVKLTREQSRRVEAVATQLGVTPLLARDAQTLSTGELRKVLIARALVGAPRILLLDEVCDGLDAAFRGEMLKLIEGIALSGTQIIYTTHRSDESIPAITHVAVFQDGRIVQCGRSADILSASSQRSSLPELNGGQQPSERRNLRIKETRGQDVRAPIVDIQNADVFLDRQKVLREINWQLRRGENWVVLGANGAGKSTFLKLVASDIYPAVGARVQRFEFNGKNTIWELRHRIGYVSPLLQAHYREQLTGEQVLASGFFSSVGLMDAVTAAQQKKVGRLLDEFGLAALGRKMILEMSFGELRKILTLRALVNDPELLIFDEPFDGLDVASRRDFAGAISRIASAGTQLLIVTHHLEDLPSCMTHGLLLDCGRIRASGAWPELRMHPEVVKLFGPQRAASVALARKVQRRTLEENV